VRRVAIARDLGCIFARWSESLHDTHVALDGAQTVFDRKRKRARVPCAFDTRMCVSAINLRMTKVNLAPVFSF
jgi:hypothetical protein